MIKIESLCYSYRPKKLVLDGISTQFVPGATYGLLGKNGSGKSTLLRCLCGLLYPTNGEIVIENYQPQKRQPDFLNQIFFLPEEIYLPNIPITAYIRSNQWMYPNFNAENFNQLLAEFDIPQNQNLQEMSYGQKKKFLISFALASNTKYLFMDEPTNGLDIISKSLFRKVMANYMNDERCIIISTHQIKDLEQLIDHISILEENKIMFNESIERISQLLRFSIVEADTIPEDIIYSETLFANRVAVSHNSSDTESIVDLELLYKAVLFNPNAINGLFGTL